MRKARLILLSIGTLFYIVPQLAGCSDIEQFTIDAPEDLQEKIDSIAREKAKRNTGDTTYVTITTAIAGAEDYSTGWDKALSQWFKVPSNRLLHVDFINHGSEANNWNNWNLRLATAPGSDAEGYSELFVIRSDAYGWGNADFNMAMLRNNYGEVAKAHGVEDMWEYFRSVMEGAVVSMEIDHSKTGNVYVTVTQTVADGSILVETYEQPVSATADIYATLVCDASWFEVKNAYTVTSKVQSVDDQAAVSISVSGYPNTLEVGQTDFWGNATATVTFADGSFITADTADITFQFIPDLNTVGETTVLFSYSKTKLGNYGTPVAGYYKLNIVNPVKSLTVTKVPSFDTYYIFNQPVAPNLAGIEVTATYADDTQGVIDNGALRFDSVFATASGTAQVKVYYEGVNATVSTSFDVNVVKGVAEVGASNYTNGWWTTFSDNCNLAPGESKVFRMMVYSDNLENWHSPCVILRKASDILQEYMVARMDHFGWGGSYDASVKDSDWDWDSFRGNICYSTVTVTVTNAGDGTADIKYDVVYANGEVHHQYYTGISVDSADLQTAIVTEESYLVIYE